MIEELIKGQPFVIAILTVAVFSLAGVIVYLYKQNQSKDKKIEDLQALRYSDLKEFVDYYKEPIAEIGKQQKGLYELLSNVYKPGK